MIPRPRLLAVPNVSEGRDHKSIEAIGAAFAADGTVRVLDVHADSDHHRSVFTLAGPAGALSRPLLRGFREAMERIDVGEGRPPQEIGQHPHVGAVDVLPVVYLSQDIRGAACAEALVLAEEVGEGLGVPVFLYGMLAGGRTRADLRRGSVSALARRIAIGELVPDFGPSHVHPTGGATLVAAREPLVAFNIELAPPATVTDARAIASAIREGGPEGLPGLRAIGVALRRPRTSSRPPLDGTAEDQTAEEAVEDRPAEKTEDQAMEGTDENRRVERAVAQVSMNVEQPLELPLRRIVEAVRRHAEVAGAELVGLAPEAALDDFPQDVPMPGFDPEAHVIENALGF
jgi:glutamate formiminotransferase/glutamate formiminotransferase/formiminotetrahydrofolate cyclodeaminase